MVTTYENMFNLISNHRNRNKLNKESIFIADQIDEEKNYSQAIDHLGIFVKI